MVKSVMIPAAIAVLALSAPLARPASAYASKQKEQSPPSTPIAADSVWVSRPDGAQSCSPKSGQALEDAAGELKRNGIHVLDSRKGSDGRMHVQMCGAPQGSTNAYLIPKAELGQAISLGFRAN